jgi:hypothetical protein
MTAYTRVIIVPSDKLCTIDGVTVTDMDMSSVPVNLHAVQWYGTWGEEEYIDLETRRMEPNVRITSLDAYTQLFAAFDAAVAEKQRQQEEASLENTITEV